MRFKKLPNGVSLLEVMMALAIAGLMSVVGFKFYYQGVQQQAIEGLRLNVDTLFMGLTNYYRGNCSVFTATSPAPTDCSLPGSLLLSSCANIPVPLATLTGGYFIPLNWATTFAVNQIVDNSGGPGTGYVLQYNLASPVNTVATFNVNCSYNDCNKAGTTVPPPQPTIPAGSGPQNMPLTQGANESIAPGSLVWLEQVAVKLVNTTAGSEAAYMSVLQADCLSSLDSGTGLVYPCSAGQTGNYLVWQRLPSAASPNLTSVEWPMMPMLKEFNLQYTHDQMMELSPAGYIDTGVGQATSTGPGTSSQAYYLCGG